MPDDAVSRFRDVLSRNRTGCAVVVQVRDLEAVLAEVERLNGQLTTSLSETDLAIRVLHRLIAEPDRASGDTDQLERYRQVLREIRDRYDYWAVQRLVREVLGEELECSDT